MDGQPQDVAREAWTEPDLSGDVRSSPDLSGHVPVETAMLTFIREGLPRNSRSIRRYCSRGDIDCVKIDTENGQRYMLEEQSLLRFIEQQKQVLQPTDDRGEERNDNRVRLGPDMSAPEHLPHTSSPPEIVSFLQEQIKRKDEQIEKKDAQIEALLERDRETNVLIKELQGVVSNSLHLLTAGREEVRYGQVRREDGDGREVRVGDERTER